MSKLYVRIRGGIAGVPDKYKDGNYIYLDLDEKTTISEDLIAEKLTEISKVEFSKTLGTTLPPTEKNMIIASSVIDPTATDQKYLPLPIDIVQGSKITQRIEMVVRDTECKEGIKVDFQLDSNHWARKLQGVTLADVLRGRIEAMTFTKFNSYNQSYVDGADISEFPLADYGNILAGGRDSDGCIVLAPSYFRPVFFMKPVMEAILCHVGYRLESPLYESDLGRRGMGYFLGGGYKHEPDLDSISAKANIQQGGYSFISPTDIAPSNTHCVYFGDIEYDSAAGFKFVGTNPLTADFKFSQSGVFNVQIQLKVRLNDGAIGAGINEVNFQLVREALLADESYDLILDEQYYTEEATHEFILEATAVELHEGVTGLCVRFDNGINDRFDVEILSGTWSLTATERFMKIGESYDLGEIVNQEIMALDVIKAEDHLYNFYGRTDIDNNVLELYPPESLNYKTDAVQGFKLPEIVDWTEKKTPALERTISPKNEKTKRFLRLEFANSTDKHVKELDLEEPLYSRKIDLGSDIPNDEITKLKNVLYEPTATTIVGRTKLEAPDQIKSANGAIYVPPFLLNINEVNEYGFSVPVMVGDSEETRRIVGPRALISFGLREHRPARDWNFFNIIAQPKTTCIRIVGINTGTTLIPTAGQLIERAIGDLGVVGGTTFSRPINEALVFSDYLNGIFVPVENLYHRFYELDLKRRFRDSYHKFFVSLKAIEIDVFTFRNRVRYMFKGKPVTSFVRALLSVDRCSDDPVLVEAYPINDEGKSVCGDIDIITPGGNTNNLCPNQPALSYTYNGNGCYIITLSGYNTSPIQSVVLATASQTVVITPLNTLQFEVCLNGETAEFTADVNYQDGCPSITTPPITLDACGNSIQVSLVKEYDEVTCDKIIRVLISGFTTAPIATISGTLDFGASNAINFQQNAPQGDLSLLSDPITSQTDEAILQSLTITFTGNCDDYVLADPIRERFSLDCGELTTAEITGERLPDGGGTFETPGRSCLDDVEDCVQISYKRIEQEPWSKAEIWDGKPVYHQIVRARRVLKACNCPEVCSDWLRLPDAVFATSVPVGSCSECVFTFSDEGGWKWKFYDMKGWTDANDAPINQGEESQLTGPLELSEIEECFPVCPYDPLRPVKFEDRDGWYVFVGTSIDGRKYVYPYFHDVFETGGGIDGVIDIGSR